MLRLAALLALALRVASAQPAESTCGAPDVLPVEALASRLAAFAPTDPVPDPYETAEAWEARRRESARETARTALAALGSERTFRVGGPVRVAVDAGRPWAALDDALTRDSLVVGAGLGYSWTLAGDVEGDATAVRSVYGVSEAGATLDVWTPAVRLSRERLRRLAAHPACFFLLARVFGDRVPVLGLDRAELVSVVDGVPHVWAWTFGDDGDGEPPFLPEPVVLTYTAYVLPEIVGGLEALQSRLVYPEADRAAGIQGTVTVEFVVSPEGVPYDVRAVRAPSAGLGRAAVEAVRQVRFTPGENWGAPVAVRMLLPLAFRLTE